eukprot:2486122-Amphidinium_carterae.1
MRLPISFFWDWSRRCGIGYGILLGVEITCILLDEFVPREDVIDAVQAQFRRLPEQAERPPPTMHPHTNNEAPIQGSGRRGGIIGASQELAWEARPSPSDRLASMLPPIAAIQEGSGT